MPSRQGRLRGVSQSSFDRCGDLLKPIFCHLHRPEKNLQATAESSPPPQDFQMIPFATVMFLGHSTHFGSL